MQNLFHAIISFFWISCVLMTLSCHKEDNDYGLPNATSKGNNTFGCLIGDVPYIARNEYKEFVFFGDKPVVSYMDEPLVTMNTVDYHDEDGLENKRDFNVSLEIESDLSVTHFGILCRYYGTGGDCYSYKRDINAPYTVNITRFDPPDAAPRIVSGTFSCTLKEEVCGELLEVAEGRFDVALSW